MRQAYSDLLRFESRLTQNFNSLQAARRRYQAVLLALAAAALACGRAAATATDQLLRYVLVGLLLVFATTIVLFFATGVYSERISRAYKYVLALVVRRQRRRFVPQANRSLRPFNLYLNTGRSSPLARWIGRAPKQRPAASSASAPLRRTPSLRSQLAPIPPPTSPRGELIFSPRVDSSASRRHLASPTAQHSRRAISAIAPSGCVRGAARGRARRETCGRTRREGCAAARSIVPSFPLDEYTGAPTR